MTSNRLRLTSWAALALGLAASVSVTAQHGGSPKPAECESPGLDCALFATPAFGADGFYLAWSSRNGVFVARSADLGRTLQPAVAVSAPAPDLDTGADTRTQLLVLPDRTVLAGYAVDPSGKHHGKILIARSTDGARSFSLPKPLASDPASQRFLSLSADRDGRVFASWIDKRVVAAARAKGQELPGASLAYAWSRDGGATFDEARIALDSMCECCRLGTAFAAPGRPAVLLRNIFDGERDHAVLVFGGPNAPGTPQRVSDDKWAIDGCPHHGPSLAIDNGVQHAVWFTGGTTRQGAFYARSTDGGRTFSTPRALTAGGNAARPYVAALGNRVWTVWKEMDGARTLVELSESLDGGVTWAAPRVVADAAGYTDHPLLIAHQGRMYLSWLTREHGYRLIDLHAASTSVR